MVWSIILQSWNFEFLASYIVRNAPVNLDNPDFTIQYGPL